MLAVTPDATHVYCCAVAKLLPPPTANPLAHVVFMLPPVTPVRIEPALVVPAVKGFAGQLTAWQDVAAATGFGDHALATGLVGVQLYVCAATVLLPPPIE